MKLRPKIMNREIAIYKIFFLNTSGRLIPVNWIKTTKDYDHFQFELHHYIPYSVYERNKQWFIDRGIEQKLILVKKHTHEQIHFQAIKNLTDYEFEKHYKISRWKLIFNKKHTESR